MFLEQKKKLEKVLYIMYDLYKIEEVDYIYQLVLEDIRRDENNSPVKL